MYSNKSERERERERFVDTGPSTFFVSRFFRREVRGRSLPNIIYYVMYILVNIFVYK